MALYLALALMYRTATASMNGFHMSILYPVSTGIGPQSLPERRLGQDLGFDGFAFALKFPELLNTNLAAVRAKLGQTSCFPNGPHYFIGNPNYYFIGNPIALLVPNRAINWVPSWGQ